MEGSQAPDDALLWQRARDGDERAFGELFTRHVQRVYNYCFRRLGSHALAEDVTQQTFIEVWRKRDVVFVDESLLPYLLVVANNVARNAIRAARRYANMLATLPPPERVPDHADEAASRIDDERRMQQVLVALRTLRAEEQDVVAMCDWEGLSYADAAAALRVPLGTVRSRLARARQRLRLELAELFPVPASAAGTDHDGGGSS